MTDSATLAQDIVADYDDTSTSESQGRDTLLSIPSPSPSNCQDESSSAVVDGPKVENNDDGAKDDLMMGVDIFDETDLGVDSNKLQLYSDGEDGGLDSDALLLTDQEEQSGPSTIAKEKSKKKTKYREPTRLSLDDKIKCIWLCCRYESMVDAQKAWRRNYGTEPPCRKTLSALMKKFNKTGSVADLVRTGRPKTTRTEEIVAKVENAIMKDPNKSVRTLAKELGVHQASIHRIRKEFEEKRNTLKTENKKLRDNLNDAMKRIAILEKRLFRSMNEEKSESTGMETVFITAQTGDQAGIQLDSLSQSGSNPTIIALNSVNGQVTVPPIFRLQQSGQESIHIIALPQGSSHHLLSLEESPVIQLSLGNDQDGSSNSASAIGTACSTASTTSTSSDAGAGVSIA